MALGCFSAFDYPLPLLAFAVLVMNIGPVGRFYVVTMGMHVIVFVRPVIEST